MRSSARGRAPTLISNGESVFFLLGNRNVDSLVVDLKDPEWVDVVLRLIDDADVLIESFRPGVMDRLGLGWGSAARPQHPVGVLLAVGLRQRRPLRTGRVRMCCCSPCRESLQRPVPPMARRRRSAPRSSTSTARCWVRSGSWRPCMAENAPDGVHGWRSNLLSAALDLQVEPLSYFLNGYTGRRSSSGVSSPYYKAPYGVFATADGHLTLSLNALTVLAAVFEDDWFLGVGEDASYRTARGRQ